MNKIILPLLLLSFIFVSCGKEQIENPDNHFWGKKKFYTDFPPFKNYDVSDTTHIFRKTLRFEFNQEAKDSVKEAIVFQLVERIVEFDKDELPKDTIYLPAKDLTLSKNGEICPDNILKINADDKKVDLEIAFKKDSAEAKSHKYTLCLQVIDNGGLDRIGNTDVSSAKNIVLADEWVVEKNYVWNPLALILFWILMVILALIFVWIILIRPIRFPRFKIRQLRIEYNLANNEFSYQNVRLKGHYRVICTNRKQNQSIFSKIFIGKISYVVNNFWDKEIELLPTSKNKIRIVKNPYNTLVKSISKGTPTEFTNTNNEKVIFNF